MYLNNLSFHVLSVISPINFHYGYNPWSERAGVSDSKKHPFHNVLFPFSQEWLIIPKCGELSVGFEMSYIIKIFPETFSQISIIVYKYGRCILQVDMVSLPLNRMQVVIQVQVFV